MSDQGAEMGLSERIAELTEMLNRGQVLEALTGFYASNARVFENDYLFAEGREEAIERQRPFIELCRSIAGDLRTVYVDLGRGISVLNNQTRFDHDEYGSGQIDGVHVYYWHDGLIAREDYYSGAKAAEALSFWELVARANVD